MYLRVLSADSVNHKFRGTPQSKRVSETYHIPNSGGLGDASRYGAPKLGGFMGGG